MSRCFWHLPPHDSQSGSIVSTGGPGKVREAGMRRWARSIAVVGLAFALAGGSAIGEEKDTYQVPRSAKKAWYWPFDGWPWESSGKKPAPKSEKVEKVEKPKKVKD